MMKRNLLTLTLALSGFAQGHAAAKPNLLIIHTDEHNFRTLGCYRKLMAPEQAMTEPMLAAQPMM